MCTHAFRGKRQIEWEIDIQGDTERGETDTETGMERDIHGDRETYIQRERERNKDKVIYKERERRGGE